MILTVNECSISLLLRKKMQISLLLNVGAWSLNEQGHGYTNHVRTGHGGLATAV